MPTTQLPFWMQVVQALGSTIVAAVIGAVAGYVAWRQWKTAEDRLRLELFERRLKVYLATKSLVAKAITHGSTIPDDLRDFYQAVEGAGFLFRAELRNYYMKIGELCWQAQMSRFSQEKTKIVEHRNKLIDKEESIVKFLIEQHETVESKFNEYLDLSRIGL